ncbi:MAG: hypothetical protein ACRCWJ_19670 [Casimicrobium sp.]
MSALALAATSFTAAQNISTIAGNGLPGFSGDGAVATSATLSGANGIALDRFGNVFVADSFNHRIRKIALDGKISTIAGTGVQGFSGDGAEATKAALNYPVHLAFAADGTLLIADNGNHRVRRVGTNGIISTVAGNGTEGFAGDGGAATAAQLNNPVGVATGANGSIYIGDAQNHRVRRVDTNGVISTVAGNGTAGFAGDGGAATAAQLNFPGAIYVAANGDLLIADYANNRVRRVASDGIISTFAGTGTAGATGDGAAATAAQLSGPFHLAGGTNGSVLIVDQIGGRVRSVASDGKISTVVGGGSAFGDGDLATNAVLSSPSGVAVDAAGQLFISDRGVYRVRKVASPVKILTEYRFAASDYYFYTARDAEKQLLDGIADWSRTGQYMLVNEKNDAGTSPLQRYYFDRVAQNKSRGSHFYTLIPSEIDALFALNPNNATTAGLPFREGIEAYAFAPAAVGVNGSCPSNTSAVYRAFRNATVAPDNPTHRFSSDIATYNALVAAGWSAEGVVFCTTSAP